MCLRFHIPHKTLELSLFVGDRLLCQQNQAQLLKYFF